MKPEDRFYDLSDPLLQVKLGVKTKSAAVKKLRGLNCSLRGNSVYWPDVVKAQRGEDVEVEDYGDSSFVDSL